MNRINPMRNFTIPTITILNYSESNSFGGKPKVELIIYRSNIVRVTEDDKFHPWNSVVQLGSQVLQTLHPPSIAIQMKQW